MEETISLKGTISDVKKTIRFNCHHHGFGCDGQWNC